MKKTLSIILALMLILSLALPVYAEGAASISVGSASGKPGDPVSIPVYISNNPGFASAKATITYDSDVLELTGMSNGLMNGAVNGALINHASMDNVTSDGVLFTANFVIRSDAPAGTSSVGVSVSKLNNVDLESVLGGVSGGSVTVSVDVQSITLSKYSAEITTGSTETITATVNPANAPATVSWSSSDPTVASVNGGTITAFKAGSATITASAGGVSASCAVTVKDPYVAVENVTLNNTTLTLIDGETATLTATVEPVAATNKNITWSSSDSSVVTVSGGKLTALKPGSATITAAAADGKSATCAVTVSKKAVTSVSVSPTTVTLMEGESATVTATVTPSDATDKTVTWTSSDTSVATVSGGVIMAKGKGTATITATADGKNASCTVTVNAIVEVKSIKVNPSSLKLTVGDTGTVSANVSPDDATYPTVTWTSGDKSIITVDRNTGTYKAVSAGKTTLTATADGVSQSCSVTVEKPAVPVESVTLNKSTVSLDVGASTTLTATVKPDDATNKTVVWSSGDEKVATVSGGTVKAVSAGTATITATVDGKSASCTVTVKVPVASLKLNKSATTISVGGTETLTAIITPENATNQGVTWSSSDTSIVTVSNGTIKGIKAGTAKITVKAIDGSEKTASCDVTVSEKEIAVTGVSLNKTSVTITEGETETLTATVAPADATNQNVKWTSSDTSVVTVSGGKLTAVKPGTATITVTADGDKTATCAVTVKEADRSVKSVSLNKSSTTMKVGGTETLTATITPSNAKNTNVTWTSSNTSIVTVSGGKLTALKKGSATITVKTEDGGKTATCSVSVLDKDIEVTSITLDKAEAEVSVGEIVTLKADIEPEDATNQNIKWTSSDDKIATVSGGVVTGVSVGTATITAIAESGNKSAACVITVKPAEYKMTEGASGSWEKGGTEGLAFRSEAEEELKGIEVDGEEIGKENYTVEDGLITINPEYLENLELGLHTISLVSENGVATTQFTIVDGEKQPDCLHENTHVEGFKEATCLETGYSGDVYCDDCDELISEGMEVGLADHEYENGVCKVCGAADPDYVPEKSNGLPKWVVPVAGGVLAAAVIALAVIVISKSKRARH